MTVSDLIRELASLNGDMKVVLLDAADDSGATIIPLSLEVIAASRGEDSGDLFSVFSIQFNSQK